MYAIQSHHSMGSIVMTFAIMVAVVMSAGCTPKGTIYQQRTRAVIHDPFPSDTLGPPIEGARPMEFERPLSEPDGLQALPPNFGF